MYATIEDLKKRLKRVYAEIYADDVTGEVDESLMTDDLSASAAEIDGRLASRYFTPVTAEAALPLLKSWNLTLAEELAWSRGGRDALPENVKTRVKTVRTQLDSAGSGNFSLPAAPAENPAGPGSAAIIEIDEPFFTSERMKGY